MAATNTARRNTPSLFAKLQRQSPRFALITKELGFKSGRSWKSANKTITLSKVEILSLFQLMRKDFGVFASEVIGLDNSLLDSKISDYLTNKTIDKLCVALPQNYKDSTELKGIISAYLLWEIAKNHGVRILLVSKNIKSARALIPSIKSHIQSNQKYQEWTRAIDPRKKGVIPKKRMVRKRPEKWSAEAITVNRDDFNLKDETVAARGRAGSILGRRADIVIVYDLTNEAKAKEKKARDKVIDWVYATLTPVLVPPGKFVCVGTVWRKNDFISTISRDKLFEIIHL